MRVHSTGLRKAVSEEHICNVKRCREPFSVHGGWRICVDNANRSRSLMELRPGVHDVSVERENGFHKREIRGYQSAVAGKKLCAKTIHSMLKNALLPDDEKKTLTAMKKEYLLSINQVAALFSIEAEFCHQANFDQFINFFKVFVWSEQFFRLINVVADMLKGIGEVDSMNVTSELLSDLNDEIEWNIELELDEYYVFMDYSVINLIRKMLLGYLFDAVKDHLKINICDIKEATLQLAAEEQAFEEYKQLFTTGLNDVFKCFFMLRQARSDYEETIEEGVFHRPVFHRTVLHCLEFTHAVFQLDSVLRSLLSGCQFTYTAIMIEQLTLLIQRRFFSSQELSKIASLVKDMRSEAARGSYILPALIDSRLRHYCRQVIKRYHLPEECENLITRIVHHAFSYRLDYALVNVPPTYREEYRDTIIRAEYAECDCPVSIRGILEATSREAKRQGEVSEGRLAGWGISLKETQLPPEWRVASYKEKLQEAAGSAAGFFSDSIIEQMVQQFRAAEKRRETEMLRKQRELIPLQNVDIKLANTAVAALQGRRRYMEDRAFVMAGTDARPFDVMMVCDGHGGSEAAEFMCNYFIPAFYGELEQRSPYNWSFDVFYNALLTSSVKVSHQYRGNAGTTATITLYHQNYLYVCNIGDSTTLLINPDTGDVTQLSAEELMTDPATVARVSRYGGEVDTRIPGHKKVVGLLQKNIGKTPKLSMSSAVGDPQYGGALTARPNISYIYLGDLHNTERLVVCYSDGVSEVDSVGNIADFICAEYRKSGGNVAFVTEALASQAFLSGSGDNITVLIRRLSFA